MGNLRSAGRLRHFKLFRAALPRALKNQYFTEKSTKSVVKVFILALDMTFLQKFDPRTDLGCPCMS